MKSFYSVDEALELMKNGYILVLFEDASQIFIMQQNKINIYSSYVRIITSIENFLKLYKNSKFQIKEEDFDTNNSNMYML